MGEITEITYGRSIIPANERPDLSLQKYESETFMVKVKLLEGDTSDDAFAQAEKEVLIQHEKMQERRETRDNLGDIRREISELEQMIADADEFTDVKKVQNRIDKLKRVIEEAQV